MDYSHKIKKELLEKVKRYRQLESEFVPLWHTEMDRQVDLQVKHHEAIDQRLKIDNPEEWERVRKEEEIRSKELKESSKKSKAQAEERRKKSGKLTREDLKNETLKEKEKRLAAEDALSDEYPEKPVFGDDSGDPFRLKPSIRDRFEFEYFCFNGWANERTRILYDELWTVYLDINKLLVESRFHPVMGIDVDELDPILASSLLRPNLSAIENYLDSEHNLTKEETVKRLDSVTSLVLPAYIDPTTLRFYKQILKCYVSESYEASCVLCRAIAETVAKRYIVLRGYESMLVGPDRNKKQRSILDIFKNVLEMDSEVVALYSKICSMADGILHLQKNSTDKEALATIKQLQKFLVVFPKQL